jgi:hypothetical protein
MFAHESPFLSCRFRVTPKTLHSDGAPASPARHTIPGQHRASDSSYLADFIELYAGQRVQSSCRKQTSVTITPQPLTKQQVAYLKRLRNRTRNEIFAINGDRKILVYYASKMSRRGILTAFEVRVKLDAKPGVAVLGVRLQESFDLIPGTRMTWITSDDAQK